MTKWKCHPDGSQDLRSFRVQLEYDQILIYIRMTECKCHKDDNKERRIKARGECAGFRYNNYFFTAGLGYGGFSTLMLPFSLSNSNVSFTALSS